MDGMAEGLEEESKKSLQMEAELEKQLAQFDTEKQQMKALLQRKEDRYLQFALPATSYYLLETLIGHIC